MEKANEYKTMPDALVKMLWLKRVKVWREKNEETNKGTTITADVFRC